MPLRRVLVVLAALAMSCLPQAQRARPVADPIAMRTVRVWVQAHADLPADVILDACNMWNPAGVRCERETRPSQAQILVFASIKECLREDGVRKLAWSRHDRSIEVCLNCFAGLFSPDLRSMKIAVAHEVGHQLGIWEHVQAVCDAHAPVAPDGTRICGKALMNLFLNEDLWEITPLDILAYRRIAPH